MVNEAYCTKSHQSSRSERRLSRTISPQEPESDPEVLGATSHGVIDMPDPVYHGPIGNANDEPTGPIKSEQEYKREKHQHDAERRIQAEAEERQEADAEHQPKGFNAWKDLGNAAKGVFHHRHEGK